MEGVPKNNPKLEQTGVGRGGYPEYKVVRQEEPEEVLEIPADEVELIQQYKSTTEKMPVDLNPEQAKELRGVLGFIYNKTDAANKYVRSGLAAMALTGALGVESTQEENSSPVEKAAYTQDDLSLDSQTVDVLIDQENFTAEVTGRLQNPEQYMGEFDKRVFAVSEKITDWDVKKTMEFANRPVVGAEGYTRAEYVAQAMQFEPWNAETREGMPVELEQELRKILPGLCAQESRFDADSESSAGAKGILQIMPDIWERYGGQPGGEKSLVFQVEVAGKLLSDMYKQLNTRLGGDILNELRSHFPSEEAFQKQFMLLALLNSYNAGDGTVAEAVRRYLEDTDAENRPAGKDLYAAVGDYGRLKDDGYLRYYKAHSHNYPYQVLAMAEKINNSRG